MERRETQDVDVEIDRISHLFKECLDPMTRALERRCGSVELAEECLSEAFAAACQRAACDDNFMFTAGWLYTVARRRMTDHWRRGATADKCFHLLRARPIADTEMLVADRDAVEQVLGRIPERQGAALKLKYLHQQSTVAVASQMELS